MSHSKKKSASQRIVGVAAAPLPSGVRRILGTRLIASLIVLAVPVLYATGVITFEWENGRPRISVNRERAAEVKQQAATKIQDFKSEHSDEIDRGREFLGRGEEENKSDSRFAAKWGKETKQLGDRVIERVEDLGHRQDEPSTATQQWSFAPATTEQPAPADDSRPLSKLKQALERRN